MAEILSELSRQAELEAATGTTAELERNPGKRRVGRTG